MISKLSAYITAVNNQYKRSKPFKHLFFRGHSDAKKYKLKPTIFRNPQYIEKDVLLDFKQYAPVHNIKYDFLHERDKVLADMQHFKLPTRLLDWTLAPLNALYFACCQNKKDDPICCESIKNGEVIVLDPWKYWKHIVKNSKIHQIHDIHIISRALLSGGWQFDRIKTFIEQKYEYKGLQKDDIQNPFAYIPSYTNPRILHQRGCFTIHGLDKSEIENIPEMSKYIKRIEIEGTSKTSLLEELNRLYINEYAIYPDFEGMQKMIKNTRGLFNLKYI